jgi:hypothetical protein
MRLKPSLFLSILFGCVSICILIALMLVLGLWLVVILGYLFWRRFKHNRAWFQAKKLCLNTSGQGEWEQAGYSRGFKVGPHTLITPFLIILHCQSVLSRRASFKWIARDSCTPQDFRSLFLKLKQILSKCE